MYKLQTTEVFLITLFRPHLREEKEDCVGGVGDTEGGGGDDGGGFGGGRCNLGQ